MYMKVHLTVFACCSRSSSCFVADVPLLTYRKTGMREVGTGNLVGSAREASTVTGTGPSGLVVGRGGAVRWPPTHGLSLHPCRFGAVTEDCTDSADVGIFTVGGEAVWRPSQERR